MRTFLTGDQALVLAQTSRKFGTLPSERLGIADEALAIDFDNACALRLILIADGADADDEEDAWEDMPVRQPRKEPRTETLYY